MDVAKLFDDLESNNLERVDEVKRKFQEIFTSTKESWLACNMMEYFGQTSSVRIVDILVKVQQPHDKYIFDKLSEWIRNASTKALGLTLFGHIIQKRPLWLYKVGTHQLVKDVLKLSKLEKDITSLINAVLCIIDLLPVIPLAMGSFVQDLFDVFNYLATWKQNETQLPEYQLIHLQFGLYELFTRLYGMYPCNFVAFLKQEYASGGRQAVFQHTIKPLLDTVKIHPRLVLSDRDSETSQQRWKNMEPHDVVNECARMSLETHEPQPLDSHSQLMALGSGNSECPCYMTPIKPHEYTAGKALDFQWKANVNFFNTLSLDQQLCTVTAQNAFWSPNSNLMQPTPPPTSTVPHTPIPTPSYTIPQHPAPQPAAADGASPPEAAVEATPETTPMKDLKPSTNRPYPTSVKPVTARAIWTPSQPASPIKKDPNGQSHFNYDFPLPVVTSKKLLRVLNDRNQSILQLSSTNAVTTVSSNSITTTTMTATSTNSNSVPSSPLPIDQPLQLQLAGATVSRNESPMVPIVGGGAARTANEFSQEDQEVNDINTPHMHHSQSLPVGTMVPMRDFYGDEDQDQGEGSPCSAGGLHFKNSQSVINYTRRRLRSQCLVDSEPNYSTGTSPADTSGNYMRNGSNMASQLSVVNSVSPFAVCEGVGNHTSNVLLPQQQKQLSHQEHHQHQQQQPLQLSGRGSDAIYTSVEQQQHITHYQQQCQHHVHLHQQHNHHHHHHHHHHQSSVYQQGQRRHSLPDLKHYTLKVNPKQLLFSPGSKQPHQQGLQNVEKNGAGENEGGRLSSDGSNAGSSPSEEEAISAATHFHRKQEQRSERVEQLARNRELFQILRASLAPVTPTSFYPQHHHHHHQLRQQTSQLQPSTGAIVSGTTVRSVVRDGLSMASCGMRNAHDTISTATQTVISWPQPYEQIFYGILQEELRFKNNASQLENDKLAQRAIGGRMDPYALLDQYIEMCAKKRATLAESAAAGGRLPESYYQDHIRLLHLQLQYERHRREIHAERNRRLLGKSRKIRALEQNNEAFKDHISRLTEEITSLNVELSGVRRKTNVDLMQTSRECLRWKEALHTEQERTKEQQLKIEALQVAIDDEARQRREVAVQLEHAQGEMFDLRSELRQALGKAELGQQYRDELTRLQSELIMMGEIQLRCKEKLSELDRLKARDAEIALMKANYHEEWKELKGALQQKSAQLETAKERQLELEQLLIKREETITHQKRTLKCVKEEYQEKFKALENKYEAQKAIIIRMEDSIEELRGNNCAAKSPDSDRTDAVGSLDHTSPLSLSLASSEGLSEIRNLSALVAPNSAGLGAQLSGNTSNAHSTMISSTASSELDANLQTPTTSNQGLGALSGGHLPDP
ncbi:hamartin [Anopheles darlingi]|uniref:hamartin n=1 Tax=Anopheles darlingi TaxID=43151 RepID=UPI0021003DCE|nr:hamartin [Anopheles darlingi]